MLNEQQRSYTFVECFSPLVSAVIQRKPITAAYGEAREYRLSACPFFLVSSLLLLPRALWSWRKWKLRPTEMKQSVQGPTETERWKWDSNLGLTAPQSPYGFPLPCCLSKGIRLYLRQTTGSSWGQSLLSFGTLDRKWNQGWMLRTLMSFSCLRVSVKPSRLPFNNWFIISSYILSQE